MAYCKYHPLVAAVRTCLDCQAPLCAGCCAEEAHSDKARCLSCNGQTQSLGVTADTEPFWRHLEASFRYPLNKSVISFVLIIALLSVALISLPWPIMIGLNILLSGIMVKYCFNCLSETAMGKMTAPDITSAYQGGVILVIRLIIALVLMVAAVAVVGSMLSESLATMLGFFLVIALPAMIILYAMSESMSEALNPLKIVSLMKAIGVSYGVILGILLIMISSVEVLQELLGAHESVLAMTLQSAISNYYAIVMFHLMGYMIFQYQHRLGYTAEQDTGKQKKERSLNEKYLSRIQILTKEGQLDKAGQLYEKAIKEFPKDETLITSYFQFTLALLPKTADSAPRVLDRYFEYLIGSSQYHKLYPNYTRARIALPKYIPQHAELRHQLAQVCYNNANSKLSVKLLKGLHTAFPDYSNLLAAYELLARALEDIPGMEQQAVNCRQFNERLKSRVAEKNMDSETPKTTLAANKAPISAIETGANETGLQLNPLEAPIDNEKI